MYTYTFGGKHGKKHILYESTDRVVVRTRNARDLDKSVFSDEGLEVLKDFNVEMEFPDADVTVLKTRDSVTDHVTARDNARSALKNEPDVRFAGRVLVEADGITPVIYTENIFIKFFDTIKIDTCEKILAENKLTIKQRLTYARNTFFVSAPEDTGLEIFKIAEYLLNRKEVELCHPELIRKKGFRNIHSKQWHLKDTIVNGLQINAGVKADQAHRLSQGENIVIAVIDDGFDIDHNEFNQPAKVIHARDITLNSNDPRPKNSGDNHGTACAGVATAAGIKASGVAPKAVLMPIRLHAGLGSIAEANAFKWAVDHGADIISCSWGPMDGYWTDPDDPVHTVLVDVPDHTRLAIDYALSQGREGKGCIITFAAGNGNEDIRYDGYASYHKVLAVAACNDTNKRSVYSDFGQSVWCTFPSSDVGYPPFNHPDPLTQGIYTTDRIGVAGYNRTDDYTGDFGGTSSACPGVAGIIALILSVNPGLNAQQVKEIIRETAEKIDPSNGQYDLQGHSIYYGYGKVNAEEAVKKALALRSPLPADLVKIVSALVNPKGSDKGAENITLLNTSADIADIYNWSLEVKGRKEMLTGILSGGEARTIRLDGSGLKLPNTGATIYLLNAEQEVIHAVTYRKKQIQKGVVVEF
jgi:subtilisin family serine protease